MGQLFVLFFLSVSEKVEKKIGDVFSQQPSHISIQGYGMATQCHRTVTSEEHVPMALSSSDLLLISLFQS